MKATLILLVAAAAVVIIGTGCGGSALATEATVTIRYSRFEPKAVTVAAGVPVTITLKNDDPIDHEWIVGTADVHERHRTGTEPSHDTIRSEVTVPAFETRETTLTFEEPGDYLYICHLPGHEQYGMVGTLHVVEG